MTPARRNVRPALGAFPATRRLSRARRGLDNRRRMARKPHNQLRRLGLLLAGLGAVVFALSMFSNVDARLLAAVSATALVLAGVYLTLPAAVTANARYRFQPAFQAVSGLVGVIVAAAFDYAVTGGVDWTLAVGVGIGVLIGSGFFRSRRRA